MKITTILLFCALFLPLTIVQADQSTVYQQDFSSFAAGVTAEEMPEFFSWSEFPHPLNPTTEAVNGDMQTILNSKAAYATKAGSTVITIRQYHAVEDRVSFYATLTFVPPSISTAGISLMLNENYAAVYRWDLAITNDAQGRVLVRVDQLENATQKRVNLIEKPLPGITLGSPVSLGLRISRSTGLLEVLLAREPVMQARVTSINLATMSDNFAPGIFAYNGQAARFDNLVMILNEPAAAK
jgi:hypothetical protein